MTTMTRYDGSTAMATDGPEEGPDTGQESSESLLRRYKETGDDALKWELVLRFENQIRRIATRAYGVGLGGNQLEDVVHEGLLTLLGAVDRFDPDKGVKLETYVTKRLRGMMIDLSRKEDWLPRQLRQKFTKVNRAVDELSVELGRTPYSWEVARRLGMSLKEYEKTLSETAGANLMSFEMLLDAYGSVTGQPLERQERLDSPEVHFEEQELHKALITGIENLRPNEQLVLSLYYEKELTMKEIAEVLGISAPRVSQIHSHAIARLRTHLKEQMAQ